MNTFSQVMRDWQRMCNFYDKKYEDRCCDFCPLRGQDCGAIYDFDWDTNFNIIEQKINEWKQDHPCVYPTWRNFISEQMRSSFPVESYLDEPISEEIANKLNIMPIQE